MRTSKIKINTGAQRMAGVHSGGLAKWLTRQPKNRKMIRTCEPGSRKVRTFVTRQCEIGFGFVGSDMGQKKISPFFV